MLETFFNSLIFFFIYSTVFFSAIYVIKMFHHFKDILQPPDRILHRACTHFLLWYILPCKLAQNYSMSSHTHCGSIEYVWPWEGPSSTSKRPLSGPKWLEMSIWENNQKLLHMLLVSLQKLIMDGWTAGRTDGHTDRQIDGQVDRRTEERIDRWTDRRAHKRTDKWTDGQVDKLAMERRMNEQTDGWMNERTERESHRRTDGWRIDRQTDGRSNQWIPS